MYRVNIRRGDNFLGKKGKSMYMYFLKNLLLYSLVWFGQTECIVIMSMEGYTKFMYTVVMIKGGSIKMLNFMIPRVGVPELRCGHLNQIVIQ